MPEGDSESTIQSMLQLTGIQEFLSQVDQLSKKAAAVLNSNMKADQMEASYVKAFENIAKTVVAFSAQSKQGISDVVDLLVELGQFTRQQGSELTLFAGNLSKIAQGEGQVKVSAQSVTAELTKQETTLQRLNNLLREIAIAEARMATGAGSQTIYGEHGVSVQEARSAMNMPQLGSTDITEENLARTRSAIEERIDAIKRVALVEKDAANAVADFTVKEVAQQGSVLDLKAKIDELNQAIEATAKNLVGYEQKGQMGAAKIAQTNIANLTKDLKILEQQLIKTSAIGKESLGALGAEPIPLRASALGAPNETVMKDLLNRSLEQLGVSLGKYEPSTSQTETAAIRWGKDVERVLMENMIARGEATRDQFQVALKGTLFGADIGGTADIVDYQKKTVLDVKASSERVIADLQEYANGTRTFAEIGDRAKRYILQIETYARLLEQKLGLAAGTYKAGFQPVTPYSRAVQEFGGNVTAATVTKPENLPSAFTVPRMQDLEYQKAIVASKEQELAIMSSPEFQIPLVKYIEAEKIAKERLGTQAAIGAEVAKEAEAANRVVTYSGQGKATQADSMLLARGKVSLAEGALTIAKQEAAESQKNVNLLGARQTLVNTLLNSMKQQTTLDLPYEKKLASAMEISGLSEKTKAEFQRGYEKLTGAEASVERLENEKRLYAEAVKVNEAAQQRVKLAEAELAATTKETDELTKQAKATGAGAGKPPVAPPVQAVPTAAPPEEPRRADLDLARQEYEQSVQTAASRERILAARRRELELAKGTLESIRKEKDSGDASAEQLAQRVKSQQKLVAQKEFEVQAGKKSLDNSKAQVKADLDHVKLLEAQRPQAVQEDLTAYQTRVNALIAQAQQAAPKSMARKEAVEDLKSESKQLEVVIAQRKSMLLQREQELARVVQVAEAKKAEATVEGQAAKAAQSAYIETVKKGEPSTAIDAKNRADALDKSASAARLSAVAAKDNADAIQGEVQASKNSVSQLSGMNSALKTNASALDDSEKKARTWQDRVFSMSRVVSVFWGTLLSSIAFKAMQSFQDFFVGANDLAIKAESSLIRFGVAIRTTQRQAAQGFPGAPEKTVGEFVGTVDSWIEELDKFAAKWRVFTTQETREGFQQVLSITRTYNLGQEMQNQLMDVAAALALLEEDFKGDLPKAAEAVSRAIEGFTRPLHPTFINAIEDTDRAIKSMEMYGTAYTKLGKGNEELKRHQQGLVNAAIILERYGNVAEDINLIYGTMEMRGAKLNRTLKEQQIEMGKVTAPALLNLKAALIGVLSVLDQGVSAGDKLFRGLQVAIMSASLAANKIAGGGGIFGAAFAKMQLPEQDKDRLLRWAKLQVLEQGRLATDVAAEIAKRTNEGTLSVITFAQAAREEDVASATRAKTDIEDRLATVKQRLKEAKEAGAGPEEIARLEKWVAQFTQARIEIQGVATALSDTSEVGKQLKDTASAENWMPDPAMVADLGDKIKDAWDDADEKRVEASEERSDKLLESWQKMLDDMVKAHDKADQTIIKDAEEAADAISEAHKKAGEASQDAWKNYQDKVEEAWQGYYDDLAQKRNDDAEETEKRWRDHLRKLEDLEIEHQRRLRDIQQQYEYDLDTAAQERDAKQIYTLIRKHQFDVKQENQSYGDRVTDENRHFAQEEEDRKRQDEVERKRRRLELQHTLENLKIDYDRRLEEIQKALRREIDDALEAQKKKDADARKQETKDKMAAITAMRDRNDDIEDGYAKQLKTIEKELAKQYRALLKGLRDQVDLTTDNMKKMYDAVVLYIGPDGKLRNVWDAWLAYLAYAQAYAAQAAAQAPAPGQPVTPQGSYQPPPSQATTATTTAQRGAVENIQTSPTAPPFNEIQPWMGTLKIEVTADDNFSPAFEDKVIDSITTAVKGMRR